MKKPAFVIGRQPVLEALRKGEGIDRIYLQKNAQGEILAEIRRLAQELQVPINLVPIEKLNGMTRASHQGVLATQSLFQYFDLQQTIDFVTGRGELPLFLMLDGVTDVRNIGAMARSALCCGAQALIIPDKGVGALNEEAMKSSAGALQHVMVCRVQSLLKAVDTLHMNGIKAYTSEMKADKKLHELDFLQPCCIIMGSEDRGIQAYLMKASDQGFSIPMVGDFDSFNVSVSAGIILYEAMKQRMQH
jgi:23S rRNA (guanosine2251-2'-O)-methyltransferase